jgi:hypothetical protein
MRLAVIAVLAGALFAVGARAQTQDDAESATRLEDVTVVGRPLERLIHSFVTEVAAPNQDRSLARWRHSICVSTVNLQRDGAQYIIDRVADVAARVNVPSGGPNCSPNVIIIASEQATAVAKAFTDRSPRSFRPGSRTTDQGESALRAFRESTAPVRWWHVSLPTDRNTNERAIRLPGDDCGNVASSCAPVVHVSASTLRTEVVDNLRRIVIIVDASQMTSIGSQQLADYIAFIALAQIDPRADTSRYASVLNVFNDPDAAKDGLTDWDYAYLDGLYRAEMSSSNTRAGNREITQSIRRAHQRLAEVRTAGPSMD